MDLTIHPDFKELLALLNEHKVEYLIVGGHALAFHGAPRFTGDMDVLVRPSEANAKRLLRALEAFGFGSLDLTEDDFSKPEHVVQLGVSPVRVDLITSLTGVTWAEAEETKVAGEISGVPAPFIGREAFAANKRATGRKKDMADLEALGEDTP